MHCPAMIRDSPLIFARCSLDHQQECESLRTKFVLLGRPSIAEQFGPLHTEITRGSWARVNTMTAAHDAKLVKFVARQGLRLIT